MKQLQSNHSAQVSLLEREIQAKNKTLSEHLNTSEEIEIYVDRLEQRLVMLTVARDKALLEAEAAANATVVAANGKTEEQELERNLTKQLQEEIITMQQQHSEEIELYNEQLSKIKIELERALSDKDILESRLQDLLVERNRLMEEMELTQSQVSELQFKLEDTSIQLEMEREKRVDKTEKTFMAEEEDEEGVNVEIPGDKDEDSDNKQGNTIEEFSEKLESDMDEDISASDADEIEEEEKEIQSQEDFLIRAFEDNVVNEEEEAPLQPPHLPFPPTTEGGGLDELQHSTYHGNENDEPRIPPPLPFPESYPSTTGKGRNAQEDTVDTLVETPVPSEREEGEQSMHGNDETRRNNSAVPNVQPGGGNVSSREDQVRSTTKPLFVTQQPPVQGKLQHQAGIPRVTERRKPFRQVRKTFAHITGIHGFFSGSSFPSKHRGGNRPHPPGLDYPPKLPSASKDT